MDNQQESILRKDWFVGATPYNLAWLAGIMDGEGCIATHTVLRGRDSNKSRLDIRITVSNTDSGIIERIVEIFDSLGVRYYLNDHGNKATVRYRVLHLQPTDMESKLLLLMAIYGGLARLRVQCRLAIQFLYSRVIRRTRSMKQSVPYNREEVETFIKLLELNKPNPNRKHSSETIRATFADVYSSEDIVRSHDESVS